MSYETPQNEVERAFHRACLAEGMESDSYAIAAALRAFRRFRISVPFSNGVRSDG